MTGQHAYSTNNPDHVTLYRTTIVEAETARIRVRDALAALGVGMEVRTEGGSPFSGGTHHTITALQPVGDHAPDGWRISAAGELVPRRGKPGDPARAWIADHRIPNVRGCLAVTGLARAAWVPGTGFGWRIVPPTVFEHDGTLWALYQAEPGSTERESGFDNARCTWTPRKLSDYHIAREAHEAATTTGAPV